jgi:glycosyltransferase involved in cell wall biosynthesis
MQRHPTVSVAICLLNSSRFIDETLESVFAQTFDDYEVILVDDGSTDGCADAIERQYKDRRLTIVRQPHRGLSIARRVSIATASGDYVAFLDHDDLWLPDKLERQVAAAQADPSVALLFSDCLYIDEGGRPLSRLSDEYGLAGLDLNGTRGYAELLRRGCFVWQSTVMAQTTALRSVDSFKPAYPYIADYDTWLQLARRYHIHYTPDVLAKYRVHGNQFTTRCPEITLADHRHLLGPLSRTASIPRAIRIAMGDRLLGQHRVSCRLLLKQRRFGLAARAAFGMFNYPDRLLAFCLGMIIETPGLGRTARAAYRTVRRLIRGQRPTPVLEPIGSTAASTAPAHVWIDGTVLGRTQVGYFNLVSELIRTLLRQDSCVVHVVSPKDGRAALEDRLGADVRRLQFHRAWWRTLRWTDLHALLTARSTQMLLIALWAALLTASTWLKNETALAAAFVLALGQMALLVDELIGTVREACGRTSSRMSARGVRWLARLLSRPHGRPPHPDTIEVVVWRGRFRWAQSRRIAVVQDLTTRIHPEMHTAENVAEFDEFLAYVERHAEVIATISEHSRKDIIDRLALFPDSVSVIPMPLHPRYVDPEFRPGCVSVHDIHQPYILSVGCLEPRKNLRRLVRAFELLTEEDAARNHLLVLVGPPGWDEGFPRFLAESDAYPRIRRLGFVPPEHLPSLYHFASAVVCPSVYEGFGLPLLEAMSASSVVLASATSSLPEVLGGAGILFDPYRTEAIAAAMLQALGMTPAEAAEYRRRGRSRAETLIERAHRMPPLPGLPAGARMTFA